MRTKGEGAKAAKAAVAEYRAQHASLQQQADETTQAIADVQNEFKATIEQLALAALPNSHPETVQFVAQALGQPSLNSQRSLWQGKLPRFQQQMAAIESEPDFANRAALLDPQTGDLERGLAEARRLETEARRANEPFHNEDFQWVAQREAQKAEGVGALQSFLRVITFAETRESRAKKKLLEQFGASDWDTLWAQYQQSGEVLAQWVERLQSLEGRRERLDGRIADHEDLGRWVHQFDARLATELQSQLVDILPNSNPLRLREKPGPHGPLTTKLHALKAKMKYLGCLQSFLEREAMDRQSRAGKIERVQRLWERKPWDRLASDKTKWLVTVPAMKKNSTEKRVRWSRDMRRGVHEYDDYDHYDYYYSYYEEDDYDFLPYDVFAHGYEERMPYEGFSTQVIPDIGRYRQAHDQEKADYSNFKQLDKDYNPEEEEQRYMEAEAESEAEFGEEFYGEEVSESVDGGDVLAATVLVSEAAEEAAMEAALAAEEAAMEAEFADAS